MAVKYGAWSSGEIIVEAFRDDDDAAIYISRPNAPQKEMCRVAAEDIRGLKRMIAAAELRLDGSVVGSLVLE